MDPGRYGLEFADQSEKGQETQEIKGQVDLPFAETLAGGGWVEMMIVVPAFAKGKQSKPQVVLAMVFGVVSPGSEQVGDRVDGEGRVVQQNGGYEKSPYQGSDSGKSGPFLKPDGFAQKVANRSQQNDRNPIKPIEEIEFPEFQPVANLALERRNGIVGHEPEGVAPKETFGVRGMGVLFRIGMTVMPAVMSGPPKGASLTRTASNGGS